ncbi:Variable outer membrane protein [Borrelia duttonii CR2A]|uniref:Variable large protein n=1 Tax=Borrelia duttonii CR2A TaxID=1432657 RepID=W6TJY2_9SPIR|nr:Variable outer membrane protein [Borrelia duttonii CR2A]
MQVISKGVDGDAAKLSKISPTTDAAAAAVIADANKKDAVVAGGIVLRAMAKDDKFANKSAAPNVDVTIQIKDAAISAVTKALDTLTIAIRSTIDEGLQKVKEAMKINVNATPVVSGNGGSCGQNQ